MWRIVPHARSAPQKMNPQTKASERQSVIIPKLRTGFDTYTNKPC